MKNLFIVIFFIVAFVLIFIQSARAQTVDDVINQYINSRGGIDKLRFIKSIVLEGRRQMMGNDMRLRITKIQDKLARTDFEFGGNVGYGIITPNKGWWLIPTRSDKPEEMTAYELKAAQRELDIAGPLVDYQLKGYKASLLEKEIINGKECYQIQLIAADGSAAFYFIDTKTKLLLQSRVAIAVRKENEIHEEIVITNFENYQDFGGIVFPQTIITEGNGLNAGSITFDKIEVNAAVDEKLYKPGN